MTIPFEKSFASHEKSIYWNYEKNGGLNPASLYKNSHKKYWFNCNLCNHTFEIPLRDVNRGSWCSYCCFRIVVYLQENYVIQRTIRYIKTKKYCGVWGVIRESVI